MCDEIVSNRNKYKLYTQQVCSIARSYCYRNAPPPLGRGLLHLIDATRSGPAARPALWRRRRAGVV